MRKHDKKLFLEKPKLWEMLNLRLIGFSTDSLAGFYNCHRSSIEYQCDKFHIKPRGDVYTVIRLVINILPKKSANYKIVNGEKINLGKSYKEYLKQLN